MDWVFWALVVAVLFTVWTLTGLRKKEDSPVFQPSNYPYKPSLPVMDHLAHGNEVDGIRQIREETHLGLKDARDLYRHLRNEERAALKEDRTCQPPVPN